jgi:VWFA-related protein
MQLIYRKFVLFLAVFSALCIVADAQSLRRELSLKDGATIEIINRYGRVEVTAESAEFKNSEESEPAKIEGKASFSATSDKPIVEGDVKFDASGNKIRVEVAPAETGKRIDLTLVLPARTRLKIETSAGEAKVSGEFESVEIRTETGTIAADVPLENIRYDFVWTESRPRFLSQVELEKVEEKSAGKFAINGKIINGENPNSENAKLKSEQKSEIAEVAVNESEDLPSEEEPKSKKRKTKNKKPKAVSLNFTTARGIILLNIPPNEVLSDLRERPLTEAAKAVIRSGDSLLTDAIRRVSPKYFGDYAKTLPPIKGEPSFNERKNIRNAPASGLKRILVNVTDINNRAIADLKKEDFEITESGAPREVLHVQPTTAPFNLVLLLDVSGSVDNYVNFIRKAARNFVNTVEPKDKIAIIIFNEDIQVVSNFSTDKIKLSQSLDTFDAGGATAFYDALAYTLTETLRPLRGERTAIVALTDGDDNRSFLPFDSLLGSLQESGALVYPLYVPSTLIAAAANDPNATIDPLRARYNGLTTKAEGEGERLARVSGGIYYPIKQINEIQKAYDDIVVQLRTAYSVTFRSDLPETIDKTTASPRLKVKVKRENSFVKLGSVVAINQTSEVEKYVLPRISLQTPKENVNFTQNKVSGDSPNLAFSLATFAASRKTFFQKTNYSPENSFNSAFQSSEISGDVSKIVYKQFVNDTLREFKLENFDVNRASRAFFLTSGAEKIAVSRWISPKRTRSYPYERVYDTLAFNGRKVTIIPVVKDEGLGGERDFLQWDTISLLSLLDVHVVLAYYDSAEKNVKRNDQITGQKFDNNYIASRLNEIFNFKGTTRQWNEREMKQLKAVLEKAKLAYQKISKDTKTYLHDWSALDELIKYAATPQNFIEFSRRKSQSAQNREFVTEQPKEALSTDTKAKVTINNALFGRYFFTCDETKIENKTVYLMEAKHSARAKMPSRNDIKDGFVKLMLYTNLQNVKVGASPHKLKVQIRLTANALKGSINSDASNEAIEKFLSDNLFAVSDANFVKKLFGEARANNFTIILEHAVTAK